MIKKLLVAFMALTIYIVGVFYNTAYAEPQSVDYDCQDSLYVTADDRYILYRIGHAEARGEDDKGIILVINVIINRKNSPYFPNTIRGVVFQPRQFSPIADGSFDRAVPCQRVKDAVQRALDGADYSQGATFFRATVGAEGSWHERTLDRIFTHGNHHFYVPRDCEEK